MSVNSHLLGRPRPRYFRITFIFRPFVLVLSASRLSFSRWKYRGAIPADDSRTTTTAAALSLHPLARNNREPPR